MRSSNKKLDNDGHAVLRQINFSADVKVACIHVAAGASTSSSDNTANIIESLNALSDRPFPFQAGIWSGLLFSIKNLRSVDEERARDIRNFGLERDCSKWNEQQSRVPNDNVFTDLPACPPTQDRAELPNSGLEEARYDSVLYSTDYHTQWMQTFHPGATICFTQATVNSGDPEQECCYDESGNLLVGSPGGGSANRYAPVDFATYHEHIEHDLVPRSFCCPSNCMNYYQWRPSDDGSKYRPPPPACIYGDPHIITLDGLKYTFNGKGEFTLIETNEDLFTLQGRMVEVEPAPGEIFDSGSPATVFSAIVAKQADSDTVQFSLSSDGEGIITAVNSAPVDFNMLTEQMFSNVVVMDKGNKTFMATFSSGAYVEVQSANGFISLLLVSLPVSFKNATTGLMGSFNGDTDDDLAPKLENGEIGSPISPNSSISDTHNLFGITWIIDNVTNSLFYYNDSLGESWSDFYDPDYMPAFAPTFDSPELEAEAIEICGDSAFCLFDIAATKRPEVGMTTAVDNDNFDMVVNMSQPVVCDPPCENGACVTTNSCLCTEGYIGDTCSIPVFTDCEENVCEGGGACKMLAGSFICTCPPHLTGTRCDLLLPPKSVSDSVSESALMAVPIIIHPDEFGFDDYNHLISLCYEVHGAPGHIANLVSSKCTSINARYEILDINPLETTFGSVGIRTVDNSGECSNIQVNRDCSVQYNGDVLSTNFTSNNITIDVFSDSIGVTIPNCDREITVKFMCLMAGNKPTINLTITRNYIDQDDTHGLIGQFWSAEVTSEPYTGDTTGLIPGYNPYILTVVDPETGTDRKFVGALIPRLWNRDAGQCVYAGNSRGGSTGTGPTAPQDSVIQGQYRYYRVRNLFEANFRYSKFKENICS